MTPEEREIDELIDAILSHRRVDWDALESRTGNQAEQRWVRTLRDVARVADFHQSLQQSSGSPADLDHVEAWGDLLLLERLRSGASGDVYRAWDPALRREVALKLLRSSGLGGWESEDWLEEARALARVRDLHVVAVHGAAIHDGRAGLWMEFLRGTTLEERIAAHGPLGFDEVARLGVQLGGALGAVHAAGVLHRDLKPANVVLEPEGRAVLTDFGLGRRDSPGHDPQPFSGTPLFMSPQRLSGSPAKAGDDLYALGVTLRWAVSGVAPYLATTLDELRAALAAGPPRRLRAERSGIPRALEAAIDRSMAADPSL